MLLYAGGMLARLGRSLRHLFTPHATNNFRARLLHNSGILTVLALLLTFQLLLRFVDNPSLHILGFTSSINIDEVVRMTNERRLAAGLPTLKYNEKLADAARRKAANMFAENYWAHNSPSGINPWHWFNQAGYSYVHAGENLAKDFGSTDRMMDAWMASPTHRDNILNGKYEEIGLAVVPGTLQGQETVLVVQLFGASKAGAVPQVAEVNPASTMGASADNTPAPASIMELEPAPTTVPATIETQEVVEAVTPPQGDSATYTTFALFNEFSVKQLVAILTTVFLLLVLVFDLVLAESQQLSRRVGKNWAHIVFINVILILVTIVQAGRIL